MPDTVSIRVTVPLHVYEKISAYRHDARHDTRAQALTCLLNAGLAALSKPAHLPSTSKTLEVGPSPERPRKLVQFAGADDGRRAARP
jgi:hypothetical protein